MCNRILLVENSNESHSQCVTYGIYGNPRCLCRRCRRLPRIGEHCLAFLTYSNDTLHFGVALRIFVTLSPHITEDRQYLYTCMYSAFSHQRKANGSLLFPFLIVARLGILEFRLKPFIYEAHQLQTSKSFTPVFNLFGITLSFVYNNTLYFFFLQNYQLQLVA